MKKCDENFEVPIENRYLLRKKMNWWKIWFVMMVLSISCTMLQLHIWESVPTTAKAVSFFGMAISNLGLLLSY